MMTWLVNIAYLAAAVLYFPVLVYQWTVQKKNRRGWRQRFGRIDLPAPTGPRAWIHAVSLGEINCTPALVRELVAARPDLDVVVSTTTDTGYARARQLYPADRVFRFPLDLSWMIRRAMNRIRPDLIVLVELEVWPNLVALAKKRGIPVAVVNGRLTERSCRRFNWADGLTRRMFGALAWVGAQDAPIAERFKRVGVRAEHLTVTGSLKWDTAQITDSVPGADALAAALGLDPARPLWVCGSTGPGEEAMILDAYEAVIRDGADALDLAIIPRKPERFDEVAALILARGFECVRRREHPDGSPTTPELPSHIRHPTSYIVHPRRVLLGDTMGELRKFYSLATVVFVGRSLVPLGGSDPMEVAALAKPILCGPHMENFSAPLAGLIEANAGEIVADARQLASRIVDCCRDPAARSARGRAAREVVMKNQGATLRTVNELLRLLAK